MLLASAVALPLIVLGVIALIAGSGGSGSPSPAGPSGTSGAPLAPVTASAPPLDRRFAAQCARVLAKLPVTLQKLAPRIVHTTPDTPDVVAWGDPPVILRCGVDRPASLHAGSTAQYFALGPAAGPFFAVTRSGDDEVYTTVDRAAYISVSVPVAYHSGPVPPLARAIAAALPPVCSTSPTAPVARLCTRRP